MLDVRIKVDRLEKEVLAYEQAPIETGKIVFLGDSGFTRWNEKWGNVTLEDAIRGKNGESVIVNHGFGGSTAEEQLYYYPRLVAAWKPKALVSMAFSNDGDKGYSPAEVLFLQTRMFEYARRQLPGIRIYACDVRPIMKNMDNCGWLNWESRLTEYNELLADYCAKHEDCTLVKHIASPLFFEDPKDVGDYKKIRKDIFIEDEVHFNSKGYELYTEFFKEVLADIL